MAVMEPLQADFHCTPASGHPAGTRGSWLRGTGTDTWHDGLVGTAGHLVRDTHPNLVSWTLFLMAREIYNTSPVRINAQTQPRTMSTGSVLPGAGVDEGATPAQPGERPIGATQNTCLGPAMPRKYWLIRGRHRWSGASELSPAPCGRQTQAAVAVPASGRLPRGIPEPMGSAPHVSRTGMRRRKHEHCWALSLKHMQQGERKGFISL